jgi:hypothetical protein
MSKSYVLRHDSPSNLEHIPGHPRQINFGTLNSSHMMHPNLGSGSGRQFSSPTHHLANSASYANNFSSVHNNISNEIPH